MPPSSDVAAFRRDAFTFRAYAGLAGYGFLNAVLGPALPYLRGAEHISYFVGSLHQVGFSIGGGLAGLLAVHASARLPRPATIRVGMVAAAAALVGVGYARVPVATIGCAFLVSLLGTSALIRMWAALADAHGAQRAVALTEGEVAVSAGSITAPLLISLFAATALGWRFAFAVGAALVVAAVLASANTPVPATRPAAAEDAAAAGDVVVRRGRRPAPTLVLVFAIVGLEVSIGFWLATYLVDDVGLGRALAVTLVAVLYAANLGGRLLASRLARVVTTERLLLLALVTSLAGLPLLLTAAGALVAGIGLVVIGAGIGATFPLASTLHIQASPQTSDSALGAVLVAAAFGQVLGPVVVGVIAEVSDLRLGLLTAPVLIVVAALALRRAVAA